MIDVLALRENGSLVVDCPYCGEQHHHGMQPGPRLSHCIVGARQQYNVIDTQAVLEAIPTDQLRAMCVDYMRKNPELVTIFRSYATEIDLYGTFTPVGGKKRKLNKRE